MDALYSLRVLLAPPSLRLQVCCYIAYVAYDRLFFPVVDGLHFNLNFFNLNMSQQNFPQNT